jgi:ERCC4-related helicase
MRQDIVYFAEKYAVVMTDEGIQQVKLREYQKRMFEISRRRFNIVLASRQMGKTVTASIFNAWYFI